MKKEKEIDRGAKVENFIIIRVNLLLRGTGPYRRGNDRGGCLYLWEFVI